jgi:hypothetical protein
VSIGIECPDNTMRKSRRNETDDILFLEEQTNGNKKLNILEHSKSRIVYH